MIDNDLLTYFTPLFVMILVMSCCIRLAIRGCGGGSGGSNRQSLEDYHSQYYVGNGQHYSSGHLYLDENNRVRSVMIATRLHDGGNNCSQIMGYVLDPNLLASSSLAAAAAAATGVVPPRYEDAIKPIGAPPRYEASESSISFTEHGSVATTARLESTIDETSESNISSEDNLKTIERRHSLPYISNDQNNLYYHSKSAR